MCRGGMRLSGDGVRLSGDGKRNVWVPTSSVLYIATGQKRW